MSPLNGSHKYRIRSSSLSLDSTLHHATSEPPLEDGSTEEPTTTGTTHFTIFEEYSASRSMDDLEALPVRNSDELRYAFFIRLSLGSYHATTYPVTCLGLVRVLYILNNRNVVGKYEV